MKQTNFASLPIGAIFFWGGMTPERANWGRKRSSRTADYRPRLNGELTDWSEWGYWGGNEAVWTE